MIELYPSLLAADEHNLESIVKKLEPVCPGFHIDIMDGTFVPNAGISIEKTNSLAKLTYRQIWVHLMVTDPEFYLDKLQLPPDSIVTFHVESNKKTFNTIIKILEKKWLPSIALKPKTGINEIFSFLDSVYQVLIMSVEPGASGQIFIEETLDKVSPLLGYRDTSRGNFKIAIDGGVNDKNIRLLAQRHIDQAAIGSALFRAKSDVQEAYKILSALSE